jgi:hypothetical protein
MDSKTRSIDRSDRKFDILAKTVASGASRRTVLRGLAGGLALLAGWGARPAAASAPAGGIVYLYYQAIAAHDYETAYSYLGGTLTQNRTLAQFTDGFSDTTYVDLTVNHTAPDPDHLRNTYTVTVTAWHTDGAILWFKGTYTEGREGGVPKIIAATLAPSTATGVSPLCRAGDLGATESGDSGAGQRYGTVTVVNNGATCVLGGPPTVKIYSPHHHKLITGKLEQGSTIATVKLAHGQRANLAMHWANWCGATVNGEVTTTVLLPASLGSWEGLKGLGVPPCLGDPGSPSALSVKPWARA